MKRSTRQLGISALVLLLVVVAYNLAISRTSRTSQRRNLLARVENMPPDTDCIFLGNSQVEAGCDLAAFRSAWPNAQPPLRPINLALGATSPVEHYLILKHALERKVKLKYLVYGFFDDQLILPPQGKWSDLVGNRALSYYFPAEAASFYAPGSRLKRLELQLSGSIPIVAERSSPWTKVELLRRKLEDIGMPAKKTNRYGRVDDFTALEASSVQTFNKKCDEVVRAGTGFSTPIEAIIRLAHDHGAKVVLVEMPMPSKHRETFYASASWTRLQERLKEMAARHGSDLLMASDWIMDDLKFEDATHLNEEGARDFSIRLAGAISSLEPGIAQVASRAAAP